MVKVSNEKHFKSAICVSMHQNGSLIRHRIRIDVISMQTFALPVYNKRVTQSSCSQDAVNPRRSKRIVIPKVVDTLLLDIHSHFWLQGIVQHIFAGYCQTNQYHSKKDSD